MSVQGDLFHDRELNVILHGSIQMKYVTFVNMS